MIIGNFAVVCREPDCHGRIQPEGSIHGKCAKCGMTTDEWERVNRPEDWKARQRQILEKLEALRDATCSHVTITTSD